MDCLFCKIISGEIKSEIVYNDDEIVGFKDIKPEAPIHLIFIPKKHISKLSEIEEKDVNLKYKLFLRISEYANKSGLKEGYRVIINCGKQGGQVIPHLHIHLLSGRQMGWPPG